MVAAFDMEVLPPHMGHMVCAPGTQLRREEMVGEAGDSPAVQVRKEEEVLNVGGAHLVEGIGQEWELVMCDGADLGPPSPIPKW